MKKLSPTMITVLLNSYLERGPFYGIPGGPSFAGGLTGTMVALRQRGLWGPGGITEAGRVEAAKHVPAGRK